MKFKWNPIKNIDYILDYYAILEIERFADINLKKQFHKLSKQNHPDTVSTASEDIKRLADKKFKLVNEAYKILVNKEYKELYDKQLTNFIKNKPKLISDDGTPIVSLSSESLSLDFLLSGAETFDFQELQEEKANSLIGFNQTTLDALEKLHKLNPDDEALKEAYLDQLNRQKMVSDWNETFAWQELGIMNPKEVPYQNANEYVELIESKIESIKENFDSLATIRLISCDTQPLLIGSDTVIADSQNTSSISLIRKELDVKIQERKEKVINAAKTKQDILKKIVKVRTYRQLNKVDTKNCEVILHNKENKIVLIFIVDLEQNNEVVINSDYNGKDISEHSLNERNTYTLKHNIELDMVFQVLEFINDIANNEL